MNRVRSVYLLISTFIASTALLATEVKISNTTSETVFVSFYYQNKKTGEGLQTGAVKQVSPYAKIIMEKPVAQSDASRYLVVSAKDDFPFKVEKKLFDKRPKVYVGKWRTPLKRQKFYIAIKDGKLKAYTPTEWKLLQEQLIKAQAILETIKKDLKAKLGAIRDNPYKDTIAKLRVGNDLNPQERTYVAQRKLKVKQVLEQLLGQQLNNKKIPTIAMVGSGGGDRAMLMTTYFLVGASDIGLLDATTYISALSGSTWALGFWMSSDQNIATFKEELLRKMPRGLTDVSPRDALYIGDALAVKFIFNQPVTLVDYYGGLLANAYLSEHYRRHRVYLSKQAERIKDGQLPFPIYTAINADEFKKIPDWYEFTPYEVGASWLGVYVPSWAYGRRFKRGVSLDDAPEQSLGYLLGTYGSAFAVSFTDVYYGIPEKLTGPLKTVSSYLLNKAIKGGATTSEFIIASLPSAVYSKEIDQLVKQKQIKQIMEQESKRLAKQGLKKFGDTRVSIAKINNFAYKMPDVPTNTRSEVRLADAGLAFNLPIPPVIGERPERKADIVIIFDASGGDIGDELRRAENYARAKNLKFPSIDYTDIGKKSISIFKDEDDPAVPVVIYLPRVKDKELIKAYADKPNFAQLVRYVKAFDPDCAGFLTGKCATMKFAYSDKEARQLGSLAEFNIKANKDKIVDAIAWWIEQHNR